MGVNLPMGSVRGHMSSLRRFSNGAGFTHMRYFFVDETGVIRAKTGGQAGPADVPIE